MVIVDVPSMDCILRSLTDRTGRGAVAVFAVSFENNCRPTKLDCKVFLVVLVSKVEREDGSGDRYNIAGTVVDGYYRGCRVKIFCDMVKKSGSVSFE